MKTPIIKTDRLTLRYLKVEEAQKMLDYQLKNRDVFSKISPTTTTHHLTLDFWQNGISKWYTQFENDETVRFSLFFRRKSHWRMYLY